ncbi:MAG: DUF1918 domain-containing protein [Actinobacteria bacterium]|nr:DUF1918 domain-containing protein [Actinomycetota bacterium]
MHAAVGDQYRVRSRVIGHADRTGEILEVHGPDGGPPYLVRWDDDGHVGLVFPGTDALVEHLVEPRTANATDGL